MDLLSGRTLGALSALGAALTWAMIGFLARASAPGFNPVTINAIRVTGGTILLLAWFPLTGGIGTVASLSRETLGLLLVSAVLGFGIGDTSFFASTRSLGLSRATTVSMTYPLIATLLASAFLEEPITLRAGFGTLLTLGGVGLIVMSRSGDAPVEERFRLGFSLAALASATWAVTALLLKPALQETDPMTAQMVRMPLAGAVLWATPWTHGAIRRLKESGRAALGPVVALSFLTAATSVMFVAGLKYAGVTAGTVLSSTSPLFAIPLGFFCLGERLAPTTVLGAILTVAGIVVLQL